MPDVSVFNLSGTTINVKDAIARTQASNALSTAQSADTKAADATKSANTASTTASNALELAKKIENLSRVEISYTGSTETITVTTGNHTPATEV